MGRVVVTVNGAPGLAGRWLHLPHSLFPVVLGGKELA